MLKIFIGFGVGICVFHNDFFSGRFSQKQLVFLKNEKIGKEYTGAVHLIHQMIMVFLFNTLHLKFLIHLNSSYLHTHFFYKFV